MTATQQVEFTDAIEEVGCLISAQVPFIYVVTHEESRFMTDLHERVITPMEFELYVWSSYRGLYSHERATKQRDISGLCDRSNNPQAALDYIEKHIAAEDKDGTIFVLNDFHTVLQEPLPRQMRDIYDTLVGAGKHKVIIITAPELGYTAGAGANRIFPITLEKQVSVVDFRRPSRENIATRIDSALSALKEGGHDDKTRMGERVKQLEYSDEELEDCTSALQGLTEIEVDNAIATCFTHIRKLTPKRLLIDKKQILKKSDILEYIEADASEADVGGLDEAKLFFNRYKEAHTPAAREAGVEPLRGVLLCGIPGCGKSLLAKVVGNTWNQPTLRLDVGKVMAGVVGASEGRMRQAIAQAEAMAPATLWIDEIEKSLSGTGSSNFSDGGTISRVFGTLLTKMQEGMEGITIVATANDISKLPPELVRRFNEVFFVGLPADDERQEIFEIHLKKRKRDPEKFDMTKLVKATVDYTGAEIEKAVKESIAEAFMSKRKLSTQILLDSINDTKPISQVMREQINALKKWAKRSARYASSQAEAANRPGNQKIRTAKGKELNMDDALKDMTELKTKKRPANKRMTKLK